MLSVTENYDNKCYVVCCNCIFHKGENDPEKRFILNSIIEVDVFYHDIGHLTGIFPFFGFYRL